MICEKVFVKDIKQWDWLKLHQNRITTVSNVNFFHMWKGQANTVMIEMKNGAKEYFKENEMIIRIVEL